MKEENLIGKRFGRLVVAGEERKNSRKFLVCKCVCGNIVSVYVGHLKSGATTSCGCFKREEFSKRLTKHGMSSTKLYRVYTGMKERCYYTKHKTYSDYGGRGITVCEEWMNEEGGFENFYYWAITNNYENGLTLERIDNNREYSPENCKWVTRLEQGQNKRNTVRIETKYGNLTFKELHEITKIPIATLRDRYYDGRPVI